MAKAFPILIIAMMAIFAVSGCTQQKGAAFVGGTDGLKLSFQDVPQTVFANVPFQLAVLVQNAGESKIDIGNATFVLNNAQNFNITAPSTTNKEILPAARIVQDTIMPGGQELISWGSAKFTGQIGVPLPEEQPISIAVDACYPYSTTMIARVCIARSNKICEPAAEKVVQNSGAPIQVTKFKQIAQPENGNIILSLIIEVANKGKGDVYAAGAVCSGLTLEDQSIVNVTKITLGNEVYEAYSLNCEPIALFDGEGSTSCSLTIPATTDYEEELSVVLNYTYKQRLTTEIAVIPR